MPSSSREATATAHAPTPNRQLEDRCTGSSSRVDDTDPAVVALGSRLAAARQKSIPSLHPGQRQRRRRWWPVAEAARQLEQQWRPAPLFAAWARRHHPSPLASVTATAASSMTWLTMSPSPSHDTVVKRKIDVAEPLLTRWRPRPASARNAAAETSSR